VNKAAVQLIENDFSQQVAKGNLSILAIGKNTFDFFRRKGFDVANHNDLYQKLSFENVAPVVESVMHEFAIGKFDRIFLIYNEFKNAATQNLKVEQFLPIVEKEHDKNSSSVDYLFEPSKDEIVHDLIPRSLKIQFYKALLDSHAAEHGARMTAMHQATDNATDLLGSLTLQYNKARQAAITNEILEIVSGAEALKG
jgi:F-type H+-transporting ATPase subunit gamma